MATKTSTITLTLPINTWSKPTEIREEVVQAICNAFLNGMKHYTHDWKPYIPYVNMKTQVFADSGDHYYSKEGDFLKFHECEMRLAFKALKEAGFYFEQISNRNGTWYALRKKSYPSSTYGKMVETFYEEWD